ncbi:MAG: tetratricopeptide repeat protein [Desulfobacteraceae bacterium]|nr:tetratricopeptide repeat protein [Desulfobacteraceae bacterium]
MTQRHFIQKFALVMTILLTLTACGGQTSNRKAELAEAKREIGEAYMRQGDYTAALRELLATHQLNPDDPFVHNDLGLCYMAKKRMPEAIIHFKKAVELNPKYAPARNNLGSAYLTIKKWDLAIQTFKEITNDLLYANPHYPLSNLGLAYYNKGDYRMAMRYYKEALKIEPEFVLALRGVGRTYLATNQSSLALRYLEKAVKRAPKVAEIHYDLAQAHLMQGNTAKAKFSYESVIDLAPMDSPIAMQSKQQLSHLR